MAKTITATEDRIRLKALLLILDWDKLKVVSEVFSKENCLLSFVSKGSGTASSEIIDLLGIGATEKAVFISLVQSTETPRIIQTVRHTLGARSVGAGIAFSIPLGGVSARIFNMFEESIEQSKQENQPEEDKAMKGIEVKNEMIISILNRGNSDAFMAEARKAGARGGTVINARGISQEIMKKFFKISVQDEKEMIIILADKDKSAPIMQAVSADFGASSKAAGVIFALPVDQVMSLNALS
ncbi:nitrogen regulatory protein P-II [Spirochaetia bacterium]|nr:nitrogen regulatory protein P-II [Spirochaetia bacterium]